MLSVITALEFFQHYFAKMGHRNTSCDPHLYQAIEQPMLPTSREASAAGRLRPNAESLTTPAVSRVFLSFFFCLSLNSSTLHRQRTNGVFFCCFCSSVS